MTRVISREAGSRNDWENEEHANNVSTLSNVLSDWHVVEPALHVYHDEARRKEREARLTNNKRLRPYMVQAPFDRVYASRLDCYYYS